jgi:hypothetical protein
MLSMGITMELFGISIGSARIIPEYYLLFLTSMRTAFIVFAFVLYRRYFRVAREGKVR